MKNWTLFLITALALATCKPKTGEKPSNDLQAAGAESGTIKKIDVHAHYQHKRDYLPAFFEKWNMQGVLVDVFHKDSMDIRRSWDKYLAHTQTDPELFFLCTSFIGVGIDAPDFAEKTIAQLEGEIKAGARMVKVWKNFGMVTKDASGAFIQIDDPRLQPIWDYLKTKNIPVMAHIGEPEQAWRELDPDSPHYGYYKEHPQYHAYHFPEIPTYETIITARDHWIEKNPDLNILCAHLGSMSHDVDMVAARLDRFPNMSVEPGARFGDLARQDSEKVRAFFEKYQDRIMFGSDFGNGIPQDSMAPAQLQEEKMNLDVNYDRLWKYLSSTDSVELRGRTTRGLGLSNDVLNKVYYQNVVNFLKID